MIRPLENITLRKDASGEIWLKVPNAALCLNNLLCPGSIVRKNFMDWAEKELTKAPELTWEEKKKILLELDPWGENK